jgi:hypothetical protein
MKLSSLLSIALLPLFILSARHPAARAQVLQPPKITVLQSSPKVARGLIFVAPKTAGIGGGPSPGPLGPEIIDDQGRPVWFNPVTNGQAAADFRVQRYHNRPVLTWAQEKGFGGLAENVSADYIFDDSYDLIATVHAGNGLDADAHEFLISPEDTALITIYNSVPADLSSVGGPTNGQVIEGDVQEIDIPSGKVIFEWHSIGHIGFDESYLPLPASPNTPWDYFHLNAISVDEDGNLIISARHTCALYKIDRHTGEVIWRLGGKQSDFTLGPGARFWYQHNPIPDQLRRDTFRIFDNESNGTPVLPYSRVIWIQLDTTLKSATLVRWFKHPQDLSAASQGGSQALENGDTFVGWGQVGRFSEFDADDDLIFDANVPPNYDTYRAYRFPWHARPHYGPSAAAHLSNGQTIVDAIWNGATEVASWDVLDADSKGHKHNKAVTSAPWNGLDTTIVVDASLTSIQVVARNHEHQKIGESASTAVTP